MAHREILQCQAETEVVLHDKIYLRDRDKRTAVLQTGFNSFWSDLIPGSYTPRSSNVQRGTPGLTRVDRTVLVPWVAGRGGPDVVSDTESQVGKNSRLGSRWVVQGPSEPCVQRETD